MNIERLNHKKWRPDDYIKEIFKGENLNERLSALAKEIFTRDKEIGEGNYSNVFEDPETGSCCKRIKPGSNPLNNVHQESSFLNDLRGVVDFADVPLPLVSMDAYTRGEEGRISKCNVLVMEKINGPSLEDINLGKSDIPESFNIETFFVDLKRFILKMHEMGIYHRDIADRNIMIDKETGKPFLIDFGNAVYYSYEGVTDGDKDPYGNLINDSKEIPEDLDLKRLESVEQSLRSILTK
jgi:serine/threonine protein kinase